MVKTVLAAIFLQSETGFSYKWWPFWKMAAIVVTGQNCDGPTVKKFLKDFMYHSEKFHAFIVKPTIHPLIRSTIWFVQAMSVQMGV